MTDHDLAVSFGEVVSTVGHSAMGRNVPAIAHKQEHIEKFSHSGGPARIFANQTLVVRVKIVNSGCPEVVTWPAGGACISILSETLGWVPTIWEHGVQLGFGERAYCPALLHLVQGLLVAFFVAGQLLW